MGGISVEEGARLSQHRTLVFHQGEKPIPVQRGDTEYVAKTVQLGLGDGVVFAKFNIKNITDALLPLASCMLRVGTRFDESGNIQEIKPKMSRLVSLIVGVNSWLALPPAPQAEIVVTNPLLADNTIEIHNLVVVWLPADLVNI